MADTISNNFDAVIEGSGNAAEALSTPTPNTPTSTNVHPLLAATVEDATAQNEKGRTEVRDKAEEAGKYTEGLREIDDEGEGRLRGVDKPEMPPMPSVPQSAEGTADPFAGMVAPVAAPMAPQAPMTAPMLAAPMAPMPAATMSAPAPGGLSRIDPSILMALANLTQQRTQTAAAEGTIASTPVEKAASASTAVTPQSTQPLATSQVSLREYPGGPNVALSKQQVAAVIDQALTINGVPNDPKLRAEWQALYQHMAQHESSLKPNAKNDWDTNATGRILSDHLPANSSRGMWQCIPETFGTYHKAGTSTSIYDPVASAAASMNYVMHRYHVSPTGEGLSSFAARQGVGRGSYQGY